jgi:glutathione-regulated potassium-efflux system ancillary protein KefF
MSSLPSSSAQLRALVVFADPSLQRSRISRRVVEAVAGLPGVEVRDLYQLYPDFYIDVRRERELLKAAPLVVFVFQLAWYAVPSLLKEWLDSVFKPEWTETPGRLRGKSAFAAVACAGSSLEYRAEGMHGRPLEDYLAPLAQTAKACGMDWLAPHVFYGADAGELDAAGHHAEELRTRLARHIEGAADGT